MNTIRETVTEWAAAGTKVEGSVIPGVKVLGFESPSHKRRYPKDVMATEVKKYEGVMVNFDHKRPGERSSTDRFGRIRNPRVDEARGIIGDLHFNPAHPYAAAVKWAAENDPSQYAMSHVADLVGGYKDGWFVAREIEKVHSVDVVSDGGTTASLFESAASGEESMEIKSMTREQLQAERQDLKVLTVTEAAASEKKMTDLDAKIIALESENKDLKAKLDGLEASEKLRVRNEARTKLIEEAKLPEQFVTETFKTLALESSTSDERFTALLTERKEMAAKIPATSRSKSVQENAGNGNAPKTTDAKSFASFLKGN